MISRRLFLTGAATAATALTYPAWGSALSPDATAAPATCELALQNKSLPGTVRAYVTGHEQGTDRWVLLKPDGGVYHPDSPAAPQTPLPVDCAIPLGAAGSAPKVLTLPQMYGARVYFVRDDTLDFFLNPGPSLVEPAFATSTDANYGKTWSFCEFTFNSDQLYANISYVDLVTALPIGLTLEGDATHTVAPLPDGAVEKIAADLAAQTAKDGQPWDKLVIRGGDGKVLRVISPQNLMAPYFDRPDQMPFRDVWDSYVDQVWEKYRTTDLKIDLQGGRGVFTGRVSGDTPHLQRRAQLPQARLEGHLHLQPRPVHQQPGRPRRQEGPPRPSRRRVQPEHHADPPRAAERHHDGRLLPGRRHQPLVAGRARQLAHRVRLPVRRRASRRAARRVRRGARREPAALHRQRRILKCSPPFASSGRRFPPTLRWRAWRHGCA